MSLVKMHLFSIKKTLGNLLPRCSKFFALGFLVLAGFFETSAYASGPGEESERTSLQSLVRPNLVLNIPYVVFNEHIARRLDIRSAAHFSQTCKAHYAAINSDSVWLDAKKAKRPNIEDISYFTVHHQLPAFRIQLTKALNRAEALSDEFVYDAFSLLAWRKETSPFPEGLFDCSWDSLGNQRRQICCTLRMIIPNISERSGDAIHKALRDLKKRPFDPTMALEQRRKILAGAKILNDAIHKVPVCQNSCSFLKCPHYHSADRPDLVKIIGAVSSLEDEVIPVCSEATLVLRFNLGILKTIQSLGSERHQICLIAQHLIPTKIEGQMIIDLLTAIQSLESHKREAVCLAAKGLLLPGMGRHDLNLIFAEILRLKEEAEEVCTLLKNSGLIHEKIASKNICELLQLIQSFENLRGSVCLDAKKAVKTGTNFLLVTERLKKIHQKHLKASTG